MERLVVEYRERLVDREASMEEVQKRLGLEYELNSLRDNRNIDVLRKELDALEEDQNKPEELYMVVQVYRSLEKEDKAGIRDSLDAIYKLNNRLAELFDETSMEASSRFRYLSELLGLRLLTELAIEVDNFWSLAQMPTYRMKSLGSLYFGRPILQRHPLVEGASSRNKKKILRKLCCKVAIALKLDLFESKHSINFYEDLKKFAELVEGGENRASKPLPVPSIRKKSRRGGLQAKKRRKHDSPHRTTAPDTEEYSDIDSGEAMESP
jgi:hypothetical protein